ncbi:methyltransferase domain-containing protein [Nonomuraea sp. NPDC050310]|uniref:class I SAM-dependent methyltransferase n=1 Tax=Nonomuraea sp. NPDC050310 TaxID=3154935 RepID=UPI003404748A
MPTTDPFTFTTERSDRFHRAYAAGGLQGRLYAEAFGPERPAEVDAASGCTWQVLGEMVKGLRLRPDELLVDLGCGRGGTGLWLARALSARLVGVDVSPEGVAMAAERAAAFVAPGRARFEVGTFESTGLPDACADGVVSMDALPLSPDRTAALRELARILRPGARAVFTSTVLGPSHPGHERIRPWPDSLAEAGLTVENAVRQSGVERAWGRLHALWERDEAELRATIGDQATDDLLAEGRALRPLLDHLVTTIYTVRAGS